MRHTSIGLESMQKNSSPPSTSFAMRSLMVLHSSEVNFLRSLYWRREIRFGNSFLYSSNLENRRFSLSILIASLVMDKATTSMSLNRGTTPLRGIFPRSFTKSFEKRLHISSIFTKFAYKLCIRIFILNVLNTTKLLIILDMRNFSFIYFYSLF